MSPITTHLVSQLVSNFFKRERDNHQSEIWIIHQFYDSEKNTIKV